VALLWAGTIICPCHWPLILLAVLGGTAAGTLLHEHLAVFVVANVVIFAAMVGLGYWMIRRARTERCPACADQPVDATPRSVGGER
jgi:hypothetical protein